MSQKRKDKMRRRQAKWQKARRPAESPQERQRAYSQRRQIRPRSHLMMGHLATLALLGLGGDK